MIVDKLLQRSKELKNPMTVVLDATLKDVPEEILNHELGGRWNTPKAASKAIFEFNSQVIDILANVVPAITLSFASHLLYGASGVAAYKDTIRVAHDAGLIVIGDTMFSGLPDTSTNQSLSHLGMTDIGGIPQPMFDVDFITFNPYIGTESLDPFVGDMKKFDKGVFVVVRTCEKGTSMIQDLRVNSAQPQPLWSSVFDWVELCSKGMNDNGYYGYSRLGAIFGAMHQDQMRAVRNEHKNTLIYVPHGCSSWATAFQNISSEGAIVENRELIRAHKMDTPGYQGLSWQNVLKEELVVARNRLRTVFNDEIKIGTPTNTKVETSTFD